MKLRWVFIGMMLLISSGCVSYNKLDTYKFEDGVKVPINRYVYVSYGTKGGKFAVTGKKVAVETKDVMDDMKDIFKEASKVAVGSISGLKKAV